MQVARVKNLLGSEALKLYRTNSNQDESEETVLSIRKTLDDYCIPKRNETIDILNLFSRKQNEKEPFEKYYADLKSLAVPCEFDN